MITAIVGLLIGVWLTAALAFAWITPEYDPVADEVTPFWARFVGMLAWPVAFLWEAVVSWRRNRLL